MSWRSSRCRAPAGSGEGEDHNKKTAIRHEAASRDPPAPSGAGQAGQLGGQVSLPWVVLVLMQGVLGELDFPGMEVFQTVLDAYSSEGELELEDLGDTRVTDPHCDGQGHFPVLLSLEPP